VIFSPACFILFRLLMVIFAMVFLFRAYAN
jgi:hypothetical protein